MNLLLSIIVSAILDTTAVPMGLPTTYRLSATVPQQTQVLMPQYGQQLIPELEIRHINPLHEELLPNGQRRITKSMSVTAYVDTLFYIPPQPIVCNGDTFMTNGLSLDVTWPVDTLKPTELKPVITVPAPEEDKESFWQNISWQTILIILGAIMLTACLAWVVWQAYQRFRVQKALFAPPAPKRPAEEIALEKLTAINQQAIWTKGQTKRYYTELTDVLREYICNRYGITSSEKTSDDTLKALRPLLTDSALYSSIQHILHQADLVKFAKWKTTLPEDEEAISQAFDFVHRTTPVSDK